MKSTKNTPKLSTKKTVSQPRLKALQLRLTTLLKTNLKKQIIKWSLRLISKNRQPRNQNIQRSWLKRLNLSTQPKKRRLKNTLMKSSKMIRKFRTRKTRKMLSQNIRGQSVSVQRHTNTRMRL